MLSVLPTLLAPTLPDLRECLLAWLQFPSPLSSSAP